MSEYKRLTERIDGVAHGYCGRTVDIALSGKYGLKRGCFECSGIIDHLANLEDKIESGKMIELPCKVGDTLYKICPQGSHIKYGDMWDGKIVQKPCQRCPWSGCRCFDIGYQKDMKEHIIQGREMKNLESIIQILPYIGSIWFTDKSQAEARLKELKGENV